MTAPSETRAARPVDWMKVLKVATWAAIVVVVAVTVVAGELIPPLLIFVVLAAVGLYLLKARPKAGALMLGIVHLLQLVTSAPFVIDGLSHPESFFDFFSGWMLFVASIPAIAGAWMVWRERPATGNAARTTLFAATGAAVLLAVVGLVGTLTAEDVAAEAGDTTLEAEDVEFSPESVQVSSGEVAIHVDNKDAFRHTFTIDELDVNLELPAGKGARTTFDAPAGDYEFYCTVPGHDDMKGTLSVQ